MKVKFSYLFIITVISAMNMTAQDLLSISKFREPGDILDISIQKELEHAEYIGQMWLTKKQMPNGGFQETNTTRNTSLAILALANENNREATGKAFRWLMQNPVDDTGTELDSPAWYYAAIIVADSDTNHTGNLETVRRHLNNTPAGANGNTTNLYSEILLSTGSAANEAALRRKNVDESNFYYRQISLIEMWLNARKINSDGGKLLTKNGKRIDWRRIYAETLIGSQKIDPGGGGFWQGETEADRIYNTALSILIIKEL